MSTRQVIVLRKDLNMRKGKIGAQSGHCCMAFLTRKASLNKSYFIPEMNQTLFSVGLTPEQVEWLTDELSTKIVVAAKDEEELESVARRAEEAGLTVHRIIDNGTTEFHGVKTFTGIAVGPHNDEKFIGITDHLPLL